jgi:hypothetical protein
MNINKTSLSIPNSSLAKQVVVDSAVQSSPNSYVNMASEHKLTSIGHSPENVMAYQVTSSNQKQGGNSSPATERSH